MIKKNTGLIIALLLFLAFRLALLNSPITLDEYLPVHALRYMPTPYNIIGAYTQPPLDQFPVAFFASIASLFSDDNWIFRVSPFLSSLAIGLILFYYIKDKLKSKDNKSELVAIIAIVILSTWPWHINASVHGLQASFLTLMSLLSLLTFEKYLKTERIKYIIVSGLFSYLAVMTMMTAIVVPLTIAACLLISKLKWKNAIKSGVIFGSIYFPLFIGSIIALKFLAP